MKKTGLFGGTFDPVHLGHLIIAEHLKEHLILDEVWFIPSKIHPLKNQSDISDENHRLKMLQLAIGDNPYFSLNDIELKHNGISFTAETVKTLSRQFALSEFEFFLFLGMDNVNELHKWKDPEEIFRICRVVAVKRPGVKINISNEKYHSSINFVDAPLIDISSTIIRQRVKEGRSIRYLVPAAVENYIKEKQLYK